MVGISSFTFFFFLHSFSQSTITAWNSLPPDAASAPSHLRLPLNINIVLFFGCVLILCNPCLLQRTHDRQLMTVTQQVDTAAPFIVTQYPDSTSCFMPVPSLYICSMSIKGVACEQGNTKLQTLGAICTCG